MGNELDTLASETHRACGPRRRNRCGCLCFVPVIDAVGHDGRRA